MGVSDGDWFSIDDVVRSYIEWLSVKAASHEKSFRQRLKDDPEAAKAEAIVFSILHAKRLNPFPAEIMGEGGVDFHCRPDSRPEFVVEVTALRADTVTKKSGLSGPTEGNRVGSFGMITSSLLGEAVNKASQMADYPMPRVLFIVSSHPDASLLLGAHGARELMLGTTAFSVPIDGTAGDSRLIAKLKNSVFFRLNAAGDRVEAARQSISAVILATVGGARTGLIGVLHPEPAHRFDPQTFDTIHFLTVRNWPIVGDKVEIQWIGPEPDPTPLPHFPIRFHDHELKRIE